MTCAIDNEPPSAFHIKSNLEKSSFNSKRRRDYELNSENIRIFHKLNNVMDNEKIPKLMQFGPRSLNVINKKNEMQKIMKENEVIKKRIKEARAHICREEIIEHQNNVLRYRKMLIEASPSAARLDPLVSKHIRSKSTIQQAIFNSQSKRGNINEMSIKDEYATFSPQRYKEYQHHSQENEEAQDVNFSLASKQQEDLLIPEEDQQQQQYMQQQEIYPILTRNLRSDSQRTSHNRNHQTANFLNNTATLSDTKAKQNRKISKEKSALNLNLDLSYLAALNTRQGAGDKHLRSLSGVTPLLKLQKPRQQQYQQAITTEVIPVKVRQPKTEEYITYDPEVDKEINMSIQYRKRSDKKKEEQINKDNSSNALIKPMLIQKSQVLHQ